MWFAGGIYIPTLMFVCAMMVFVYLSGMAEKVILLDAFALIFPSYYALIRNPRNTPRQNIMYSLVSPTRWLICINNRNLLIWLCVLIHLAPERHHTDFADYKANRRKHLKICWLSIYLILKIIRGFNIFLWWNWMVMRPMMWWVPQQTSRSRRLWGVHGNNPIKIMAVGDR